MQRRRNPPQEMTMTTRTAAMFLLITGNVLACRQAPAESPVDPAASAPYEEALATPVPAFEVPTPQMLQAALSGDPEAMRAAATSVAGCHAATTCPGYGACSGWSARTQCNDNCTRRCCHDGPACNEPDFGGTVYHQRYRVCFNPAGAACTEWSISSSYVCGC
jgi:hypothetical protein